MAAADGPPCHQNASLHGAPCHQNALFNLKSFKWGSATTVYSLEISRRCPTSTQFTAVHKPTTVAVPGTLTLLYGERRLPMRRLMRWHMPSHDHYIVALLCLLVRCTSTMHIHFKFVCGPCVFSGRSIIHHSTLALLYRQSGSIVECAGARRHCPLPQRRCMY